MNENIIPYVPLEPRVQAKTEKSRLMCQQLFRIIDQCVQAQILFNHDTEKGRLSISPDQINDLLQEISASENLSKTIDIEILQASLNDLIYPKFIGERTITNPIWKNTEVRVWQFQLNQIAKRVDMKPLENDAELCLDMVLSSLRVWRNSLETGSDNRDVIYKRNDLIYQLMHLEDKLNIVQDKLEE